MFFTEEYIVSLASPFKFASVRKFSHGRPKLVEIISSFETISLRFAYSIDILDNKHILL